MISETVNTELSIIIVNWNGVDFLPACLKSIVENPPKVPYEIIVVDNDSSDESVKYLQSAEIKNLLKDSNFTLIESKENLGFSRANNFAIEQTNAPYVFLLNPDTIAKPEAIDRLLRTLKSDEKIGAVAPKLFNGDGTLQFNVRQFPPTPLSILTTELKLYKLLPKRLVSDWLYSIHWNYRERTAVPVFSGAAIMAKREMINQVGAFDDDFHMYGEDFEWCVRINKRGWKTFFEPDAEIFHLGGQSSVQRWGTSETNLKEEEGVIYCQSKCISKPLLFFNLLTRTFSLVLHYVVNFITGNDCTSLAATIKLHIRLLKSIMSAG